MFLDPQHLTEHCAPDKQNTPQHMLQVRTRYLFLSYFLVVVVVLVAPPPLLGSQLKLLLFSLPFLRLLPPSSPPRLRGGAAAAELCPPDDRRPSDSPFVPPPSPPPYWRPCWRKLPPRSTLCRPVVDEFSQWAELSLLYRLPVAEAASQWLVELPPPRSGCCAVALGPLLRLAAEPSQCLARLAAAACH